MTNSILESIKKLLGLPEDYDAFDTDVMIHINSVFGTLHQLGIGPESPFAIEGAEDKWGMFIQDDTKVQAVKTYVYLRVRLLFDPPAHAFLLTAVQDQIKELEWRLSTQSWEGEGNQNGSYQQVSYG